MIKLPKYRSAKRLLRRNEEWLLAALRRHKPGYREWAETNRWAIHMAVAVVSRREAARDGT